jgi:hypothetical protein
MDKDEALKLALEALENSVDLVREDAYNAEKLYGNYPTRQGKVCGLKALADDHEKAITAIKQALAAPVQEPVAIPEYIRDAAKHLHENRFEPSFMVRAIVGWINGSPPAAQPAPVQEPVAYLCENAVGHKYFRWKKPSSTFKPIALYTTPPVAQPAVPDAIHHTDLSEHPQYIEGWNDCRAEMLKGMKP